MGKVPESTAVKMNKGDATVFFKLTTLAALLAWGVVVGAYAAPADKPPLAAAIVEGVQLPAWVQRGNSPSKVPLAPGAVLGSQDNIYTGANARLLLRLADGSTVKLGEKARLTLSRADATRENDQVTLRAALNLVVGAFRFTTDAVSKLRSKREVDIKISTVTAGIRGTDVWGAQRPDREIVCLLEGNITVDREFNNATTSLVLDQPLQFYIALKDKPANPVGTVSAEQIALWTLEPDIAAGQAVLRSDGKYKVVFLASEQIIDAFRVYDELRAEGYPASIAPMAGKSRHTYQVQIAGLESEVVAGALMARFPAYEKARVLR
jgi:hypothetical protein